MKQVIRTLQTSSNDADITKTTQKPSPKTQGEEDAQALAQLIFDIFADAKDNGKLSFGQSDAKNTSYK